ncbi:MAG: MobQ family relaxase [Christensenellales bacterium]
MYHCSIKIISRGNGKSAVAAAAYRSGEKITNEWDGMIHDYTRKRGIVHSEILLPPNAPPDFQDRGTLWNSVEQIEKACNSQLARELEVALPIELSREEQVRIVRAYCSSQFVSRGMCADFNIHDTGSGNPHAHILLTMRPMDERGKWLPKSKKEYVLDESGERIRLPSGNFKTRKVDLVDWNSQENAEVWRKAWADLANDFLERNNRPERIDHRSYERQGIDQIPTVHIGVAASQMEKKGIATERGELNRSIKAANRLLRDIKAQIGKLKEWLLDVFKAKESLRTEPPQPKSPNLSTLLFRYLDIQKAKSGKYSQSWQQQHTADELKAISKAVNLLSEKGIYTLEELDAALSAVHDKASEIRSAMKPREARIKQLQKLIEQAQNFQKTQPIHDEYKQIRWKGKQEKFAEAHRADLAVWDAANRYLRVNLPDTKLTPKAWQTELAALTTENEAEYAKLKAQREEVAELQKVRRYVDTALKADAPQKTKTKHHDID